MAKREVSLGTAHSGGEVVDLPREYWSLVTMAADGSSLVWAYKYREIWCWVDGWT